MSAEKVERKRNRTQAESGKLNGVLCPCRVIITLSLAQDFLLLLVLLLLLLLWLLWLLLLLLLLLLLILLKQQQKYIENRAEIERKRKKKLFSVFCHCRILRTLCLVINIIIIITIIMLLFLVFSPCLWWKIQWRQHVASLNCHWDLLKDIACLFYFPGDSGDTFPKFFDEFSCLALPYASCFYCNRCKQVDLQDALVFLSFGDGWLVSCVSYVRSCC